MVSMKIGLIVGRYQIGGGIAHVTDSIRNALCQEHEVVTYTCAKIPGLDNNKSIIPFPFKRLVLLQQTTGALLCRMARDCDILIYPNVLAGISGNKKPIIMYNHSGFRMYDADKYKGILELYSKIFERALNTLVQRIRNDKNIHILANAQYTVDMIRKDVGRESTVIYPSIDIKKFTAPIVKQRHGVISIGTLSLDKKYLDLCEIMTPINTSYTIMGKMLLPHEKKHHSILQTKYPNVQIIPNASEQKIKNALWTSKVYLHGKIEDFGISIVEAVVAGCIPIVPDGGGIRETIPISELRFEPGNLDAMQKKIKMALSGSYDHHMPKLQTHVKQYDTSVFNKQILEYVQKLKPHH